MVSPFIELTDNNGTAFYVHYKKLMIPDNNTPLPGGLNDGLDNQANNNNEERFESDTQKLVRRHMEDPDHHITDEEMANLRVGMNPPELDDATKARLKDEDAIDDVEKTMLNGRNIEEDKNTKGDKVTPWDIIEP